VIEEDLRRRQPEPIRQRRQPREARREGQSLREAGATALKCLPRHPAARHGPHSPAGASAH
jgi:hypothetical protein